MKHTLVLAGALLALLLPSCHSAMPAVPDSGRTVVGPEGSSRSVKPWNQTTKQEGDAVLGPLSNMRR